MTLGSWCWLNLTVLLNTHKHHRDKPDTLLPTWIIQRQRPRYEVSRYCSAAIPMVHSVLYGKSRPRVFTYGQYTVTLRHEAS